MWKLSVFVFGHFIQTSSLKPMQTVFFIIGTRKICYDYNPAWLEITWNNNSYIPGSPNDQTKWLVFRMIHVRILYYQGQNWTSWVCYLDLDFNCVAAATLLIWVTQARYKQPPVPTKLYVGSPWLRKVISPSRVNLRGSPPDAISCWNQTSFCGILNHHCPWIKPYY